MAKVKTIYWISGIIGSVFLLFLIVLRIMDKIKLGGLIFFGIILIILVVGVDMLVSFRKAPKDKQEEVNKEPITLDEMEKLANERLLENYAEYADEIMWDGEVLGMGKTATPTYFKMCRGRFTRKIYGIVYNMIDTRRGGIVEYDDTKISENNIRSHMMARGNRAALSPRLELPTRRTRTHNMLTGTTTEEENPIFATEEDQKNKEGELK